MSKMLSAMLAVCTVGAALGTEPINIGSRLELLVDDYLIDKLAGGAELRLHHPTARQVVLVHDAPWEGSGSGYHTIFRDGSIYRMYYKAWHLAPKEGKLEVPHETFGAYAQSVDGIRWVKPQLGLFEFEGSRDNNIVWMGKGSHDFTPFRDTNPKCKPGEEYKSVGQGLQPTGLYAFKSRDGIHWEFLQEKPILTEAPLDTQNVAFWDSVHHVYRTYVRNFRDGQRDIQTAVSKNFHDWTELAWLEYPQAPKEQLYTNQIKPYYRAPHIFIGFPTRYIERRWSPSLEQLPSHEHRRLRSSAGMRYGTALTESLFMTSRDGRTFNRWPEAFIRPGLRTKDNWAYGDNYIAWHVVETRPTIDDAPNELSLYATESYWTGNSSALRRYTLRIDGFVSMYAPLRGGQFTTKPLIFEGKKIILNFSTSAAGSIRVEIQDEAGEPIEGFSLAEAPEIFGDALDRVAPWKDGRDLTALSGRPIRLRFAMKDADLYSFRFQN